MSIVLIGFQLCCGEELKCYFKHHSYDLVGSLYSCEVTSLEIIFKNMNLSSPIGVHMANNNDSNVKAISIYGTNTKFIPVNLGSFYNLSALRLDNNQLIEIKSTDFNGMQDLESLRLMNNQLKSLPVEVFSRLPKLRYIDLDGNQIQSITNDLFNNNLNLETIDFRNNKIKFIGSGLFDLLGKLKKVHLQNNICVEKLYEGASEILQLKIDIKANCVKSNDVILFEIENKISIEATKAKNMNEMQFNQMNSQLQIVLKAIENQNNCGIDINELKKELSEVKNKLFDTQNQLKMKENEINDLRTENSGLKAQHVL